MLCGVKVGEIGTLHPAVKNKLDKKAGIAFLTLNMNTLEALDTAPIRYTEPSRFPSIDIDLSFVGDVASLDFAACKADAERVADGLLADAAVADIYETEAETSLTVRFTFCAKDRTLTKAELAPITDAIIRIFKDKALTLKA